MAPLIFLLVLSVFTKGAVEACCHHPCPKNRPKPWSDCTISLGFDKPPDTCEYDEHCQTCDGVKVCVNTTFATCMSEGGGLGGKWAIAVAGIAPCPSPSPSPSACIKNPNKPCPAIHRPVCGSNGKTYPNKCVAKADCEFEFTKGECSCEKGSGEPKPCPKIYDPVCGSNRKTYGNACLAEADCEFEFTKGECSCEKGSGEPEGCTDEYAPVCGSNGETYGNACKAEADCQKWTEGPCSCEKNPDKPCPRIYRPVCGSNGETYGNACLAEADCQKWTKGECCKDTVNTARKCNPKRCKKRNVFPKNCQATCAANCLKGKKNTKCPKDKKNKCPPKGKLLDCANKKTKKSCPVSCPVCVLPHNCFTKEVWSKDKVKWCCDNMQLGCPADSPQSN